MIGSLETIRSFVLTLRRSRKGFDRTSFLRWQKRALDTWCRTSLPKVGYYDHAPENLTELPITNKAILMGQFDQFNTRMMNVETAWAVQKAGGRIDDLTIGASTGTSGNRGLFIISEVEKNRWLGSILAKTMADLMWKPQRVAIILPQDTGLYQNANQLSFIQLKLFSLTLGPDAWRSELEAFNPTVIVAPPKVLRFFAQEEFALSPIRVFSAAETLDPVDQRIVQDFFGLQIGQIYMATEGLFAVSCRHGALHLAEDSVFFEFESVGDGLFSPIVTCFQRDTQIMARYQMNDLLRLSDTPCRCGSSLRVVAEIVGRMDDCFLFGPDGKNIMITPDVLRNAVLGTDSSITDFRIIQVSEELVELLLPRDLDQEIVDKADASLQALLNARGSGAMTAVIQADLALDTGRKLRRVERRVADV